MVIEKLTDEQKERFKNKISEIDDIQKLTSIIISVWYENSKTGVNYACKPYLQAMFNNDYGFDEKKTIILYALSNMSTFKGDKAKILKERLKKLADKL